jgi:membrane-associated phospholipid phosphatase
MKRLTSRRDAATVICVGTRTNLGGVNAPGRSLRGIAPTAYSHSVSPVTQEFDAAMPIRAVTLRVLGAYVAIVLGINLWRIVGGSGSVPALVVQAALLATIVACLRSSGRFAAVADWLPLAALPLLYWALPSSIPDRLFDVVVQRWDQALFGVQPAQAMAIALPSWPLSELLHLAYLLYYAIIYVPPALLYFGGRRDVFHRTVFAFTVTMVAAFSAFIVFPVEGPRFAWPSPSTVPEGPIRSLTLHLLEKGSSRGTAFPSSHVAIALAQTLSVLRWHRGPGLVLAVTTLLLALGAVYGGFHYATDIFAGAAFGVVGWWLAKRAEPNLSA